MSSKSPFTDVIIANSLVAIFDRLCAIEKATNILAGAHLAQMNTPPATGAPSVQEAVLLQKLGRLTLKRHAVLTATLGNQSYQSIAKAMQCDVSTVKLHLKAALDTLGIKDRSMLLASHPNILDFMSDADYEMRYGVGKRWWLTQKPPLMAVLRTTKPARNQHTQ